ncbi:MAG: hemolysin family protein [Rikenellaceae bacterium]|nr:hemolysin family protein [Rikenellaceae bacterium]MCL2692118.1 hemolysin family protein [Rikenellaceae bacterium]
MVSIAIIITTSLLLSAFFSGMEIAFTSANRLKLEIEKKKSGTFSRIINVFMHNPGQYITTILTGNSATLVVFSLNMTLLLNVALSAAGVHHPSGGWSILLETAISTIILILFGDYIPKTLVRVNPAFFLRLFAVPLFILYIILWPAAKFSTWLSVLLLRLFGLKIKPEHSIRYFDRSELEHLVDEAVENEKEKTESEIRLFRNAMDFSDLRVRDCMVPRVDVEAVATDDTIEHLTERFVRSGYSRIFVYEGTIDNIVGYVNTKALFTQPATVREAMREVDYIPESYPAQELMKMFIRRNRTIAVVIDEFGGTAGIVSLEDALEEIFGEIEDEHDLTRLVEKSLDDGAYIFSGRLEVEYLNEKYDLAIPESDDYDTLAGYVIFYHEGIPAQGDEMRIGDMQITALKVNSSRLDLVKVNTRV